MDLRKIAAAALAGAIALPAPAALASWYVTNGNYSAYRDAKDYLYLVDPQGAARRLKAKDLDILAIDNEKLYYATGDKIFGIDLEKAVATRESTEADEAIKDSYRFKGRFTLKDDGLLYLGEEEVASQVTSASANSTHLYYISDGAVYRLPLSGGDAEALTKLKAKDPTALAAADSHLIVLAGGKITAYKTSTLAKDKTVKAPKGEVTDLFLMGQQLYLYVKDAQGETTLENQKVSFIKKSSAKAVTEAQEPEEETAEEEEPEEEEPAEEEAEEEPQEDEEEEKPAKEQKKETSDSDFKVIQRGMKGSRVRQVQQRLRKLGYAPGVADGEYGSNSIRAVRKFQEAAGLEADGRVDEATWNALFADDAPKYKKK